MQSHIQAIDLQREWINTSATMRDSTEVLQTALRVLTALLDKQTPLVEDVAALRQFDGGGNGRELDVLCCDVIQKVVKDRGGFRGAA